MGTLLVILGDLVALLAVAVAALCAWIIVEVAIYQVILRPALERDLGFRESTAILPAGGRRGYISAVAVGTVVDDGVFAGAGFRAGDVLPDESHTSLFKKLHRHRGRTAELAVAAGGSGPPFHERPRCVVRFLVPPRGARKSETTEL